MQNAFTPDGLLLPLYARSNVLTALTRHFLCLRDDRPSLRLKTHHTRTLAHPGDSSPALLCLPARRLCLNDNTRLAGLVGLVGLVGLGHVPK